MGASLGFMGTATPPARCTAVYDTSQRRAEAGSRWMPTRSSGRNPLSTKPRARALAALSHSEKVSAPTPTTVYAV